MSLEANSVHVSPRYGLLNSAYFRTLSKNRHANFAVSSFVGFSIEENIHESESTRTLLAKASKLNMYIHNIHLHIFSIKLVSPVIAVYKQTVFPISLNCPTIPYKNFGGYPWKKIEKNIHENRLLCCNFYIVSPIIYQPIMVQLHIFIFFES